MAPWIFVITASDNGLGPVWSYVWNSWAITLISEVWDIKAHGDHDDDFLTMLAIIVVFHDEDDDDYDDDNVLTCDIDDYWAPLY